MTTAVRIRVVLADDHEIARMGAAAVLATQPDIELVAQASDGAQAINLFRQHRPDVLVVDLRMPGLDGISVIEAVRREDPDARVLVLTHYDGDEDVFRALTAGARGYLTKDARGDALLEGIRALARGVRYLPAAISDRLAGHMAHDRLTGREREVIDLVFAGRTNREIAAALGITERTAALHVGNLLAKLGARSRTEAVAIALDRGLLKPR